jgi:dipeptidyl aminopeptidase/acylaminoacyl peptidase
MLLCHPRRPRPSITRPRKETVRISATNRLHRLFRLTSGAFAFAALASVPGVSRAQAQQQAPPQAPQQASAKKVLTVGDYSKWRSIDGAQLSPDGNWVVYGLSFTNTTPVDAKPVLHILRLDMNQEVEIPHASRGVFSSDSKWIVYQFDSTPAGGRGARGGGAGGAPTPATRRYELRELATGKVQAWTDMASATFSATASHLVLKRRAPGAAGEAGGRGAGGGGGGAPGGPAAANPNAPRGADVVLHDLATGRSQLLGSVGDIAFNKRGDLLAYTVDAAQRDGNGLFLVDLANDKTSVLDNDARRYNRLTWNEDGTGVAVLKGRDVERMRERDNVLIVIPDVRAARSAGSPALPTLDPAHATAFPRGWVVSDRAPLAWSDDGKRVFFGVMPQTPAPDTTRRRSTDSIADVDVWRTGDERIQSAQMIRAEQDRNFTYREAFDVAQSKYVALADSTMRELEVADDGRWAVGRDVRGYISDYKRPAADFYRVNTSTGERVLIAKGQLTGQSAFGISPSGRYFLYWKDSKYQLYDLDAGTTKTLGALAPSFIDTEYDHPGPKPSFGIAGYTTDGKGVIVEHLYDLWLLPLDGSAARNLTNGAGSKSEIRFRYVRTAPADSTGAPGGPNGPPDGAGGDRARGRRAREIDLTKPITLSAYGEWTKKSGFYQLADGQLKQIVFDDASYSNPVRAAKADKFLFTRQTFVEFPDLRVSGADFKDSRKITDANPQQAEYAWGHRILFDFKNKDGRRLQGIIALPDDYKAGEKRPMLVNFYEKNSQNLNRYSAPSYLTGMGSSPIEAVSRGYITMIPDVFFHTGSSHSDMLDCVEAATKKVIEMGYADPKHIGLNGHSYGGEGAAFISTRSRLFAAVGVGAGVTDLYDDFSQSWGWSYQVTGGSGQNGNDYYLYGQGRWGVSPWDNPELYHFESAITHVREVTQPILIMHGTADPTVAFNEGMKFYNALRYNGKNAILLAYPGEGHGLRGLANRKDLTVRYFQFFDHYLKGAPAPKWMTDEVPYLAKDAMRDPTMGTPATRPVP